MNGREENAIKKDNNIKKILSNQPDILKEYYFSFTDKTEATKYTYICNVIESFNFFNLILGIKIRDENDLAKIKYRHLNRYVNYLLNERKNSNVSVAAKIYAIKHFFSFLVKNEYIPVNPCNDIDVPKNNKEPDIIQLDDNEIKTVFDNIENGVGSDRAKNRQKFWKNRDKALIALGLSNGIRVTALTEINVEDIDYKHSIISVIEKGNVIKKCYIPENTMNLLKLWMEDRNMILGSLPCKAVFISNRCERMTSKSAENLVKKYTYNIDKHITPHKLRSTCASSLYEKTGDIYLVADVLGHKNIQNTRKYAKISEEKRRQAASFTNSMIPTI